MGKKNKGKYDKLDYHGKRDADKRMAGQYGNERVKVKNLSVARIISESNLVLITGSVPGPNGGYVELLTKPSAY